MPQGGPRLDDDGRDGSLRPLAAVCRIVLLPQMFGVPQWIDITTVVVANSVVIASARHPHDRVTSRSRSGVGVESLVGQAAQDRDGCREGVALVGGEFFDVG
jgi:hypothetical protein